MGPRRQPPAATPAAPDSWPRSRSRRASPPPSRTPRRGCAPSSPRRRRATQRAGGSAAPIPTSTATRQLPGAGRSDPPRPTASPGRRRGRPRRRGAAPLRGPGRPPAVPRRARPWSGESLTGAAACAGRGPAGAPARRPAPPPAPPACSSPAWSRRRRTARFSRRPVRPRRPGWHRWSRRPGPPRGRPRRRPPTPAGASAAVPRGRPPRAGAGPSPSPSSGGVELAAQRQQVDGLEVGRDGLEVRARRRGAGDARDGPAPDEAMGDQPTAPGPAPRARRAAPRPPTTARAVGALPREGRPSGARAHPPTRPSRRRRW